jgi:hypothetical protein
MIVAMELEIWSRQVSEDSCTGFGLGEILLQVLHNVVHFARWTNTIYDWMRFTYLITIVGLDAAFELIQEQPASFYEVQREEPSPFLAHAAVQPSLRTRHRLIPKFAPLPPPHLALHTASLVPCIVHILRTPGKAALSTKSKRTPRSCSLLAPAAHDHEVHTQGRREALTCLS